MKFAVLLGVVAAQQAFDKSKFKAPKKLEDIKEPELPDHVDVPEISWNKAKVDVIKKDAVDWYKRDRANGKADSKQYLHDLSHAWASQEVREHVAFGKISNHLLKMMFLSSMN